MPEVGLNGLLLDKPHSGSAVYTRNLVPLLPVVAPDLDFRLFVRRPVKVPAGVTTDRLTVPLGRLDGPSRVVAQMNKLAWEEIALPVASAARSQQLMHSLYFSAPIIGRCPVIVTVHDLIPLVLQGYHRTRQSRLYSALMAYAVTRVASVITVSDHAKQDIVRVLRIPPERIHVTHEAADDRFRPDGDLEEVARLRERYRLPPRFLLYIGGAERRKGVETLVRAWALIAQQMRDREVRLVIVARFPPPDRLYPDIPGLVAHLALEGEVLLRPTVDEDDKPGLYRAATALCFPSTYEGFGFTPLEAMASGLPVITSNVTSIPEVVGDAGILLPPEDLDAWSAAMLRLVDSQDERARLREVGLQRAATFSWWKTAHETVAVYRDVLGR